MNATRGHAAAAPSVSGAIFVIREKEIICFGSCALRVSDPLFLADLFFFLISYFRF